MMTMEPVPDKRSDRMRFYEDAWRAVIPAKGYTILQVDGRAFHTLTRGMDRPFDYGFITAMDDAAQALCQQVQGCQFAYTQSDEISLLITDFGANAEPWFGGVVQKMCSIAASAAAGAFNDGMLAMGMRGMHPMFDARVFTVPDRAEAINYFLHRQADCHRNAVSMAAEAVFSSKQLHGKTVNDRLAMLADRGVHFASYPQGAQLGRLTVRETYVGPVTYTRRDTGETLVQDEVTRSRWVTQAAGRFDWDATGFLGVNVPEPPCEMCGPYGCAGHTRVAKAGAA